MDAMLHLYQWGARGVSVLGLEWKMDIGNSGINEASMIKAKVKKPDKTDKSLPTIAVVRMFLCIVVYLCNYL